MLQVAEGYKEHFDRDHYLILNSMELLSGLYRLQGRCEEAEKLALEVVNSRKASLEPDNSEWLMSIRMLVAVYIRHERWEEAEDLELPVLNKLKKIQGEHHSATLKVMCNLAKIWCAREEQTEALSLMSKAIRLSETTLGPSHPSTIDRKQTFKKWLFEVNPLLSKEDECEEDETSRDLHGVGGLTTEAVTRASQEFTESTQNVDSFAVTVATVVHDKFFPEAEKGRKKRPDLSSKIAWYEREIAGTECRGEERFKQIAQLSRDLLLEYAWNSNIECGKSELEIRFFFFDQHLSFWNFDTSKRLCSKILIRLLYLRSISSIDEKVPSLASLPKHKPYLLMIEWTWRCRGAKPHPSMTHGTVLIRPHLQGPRGYWLLLIEVSRAELLVRIFRVHGDIGYYL